MENIRPDQEKSIQNHVGVFTFISAVYYKAGQRERTRVTVRTAQGILLLVLAGGTILRTAPLKF